jgi:hypothetical protein
MRLAAVALAALAGCGGAGSPTPTSGNPATLNPTAAIAATASMAAVVGTGSAHFELTGDTVGSFDVPLSLGSAAVGTTPRIEPAGFYVVWSDGTSSLSMQAKPGFTGSRATTEQTDGGFMQISIVVPGQHPGFVHQTYTEYLLGKCTVTVDELVVGHLRGKLLCHDMGDAPYIVDVTGTFEAQIGS